MSVVRNHVRMGIRNKAISVLGIDRDDPASVKALNGIRTASDLAYVSDARTGHYTDLIWTKEPLSPLPVVIYFNSTACVSSKRNRGTSLSKVIAKRDYLVVNADLRDLKRGITPRNQMEDIAELLNWLIHNRERFSIDTDEIYVTGSSYGALAALWTAMFANGIRLAADLGLEKPKTHVKGLGLFTGMTDTESGDSVMRTIAGAIKDLSRTEKSLAEALCPWSNHDLRTLPPVFQVTSDSDSALPDVVRLDKLLEVNGVPHDTVTFHGSSRTTRGFMESHAGDNECARALSKMFTFFEESQ